jgi:hypothetical protein
MQKANEKVKAETPEEKWALVPVMDAEVDQYIESRDDVKKDSRKISTYAAARNHGYKVGQGVNVSHQVGEGSGNLALKG